MCLRNYFSLPNPWLLSPNGLGTDVATLDGGDVVGVP